MAEAALGLSPRVRGNRMEMADGKLSLGSIPACAGEPFAEHGFHVGIQVYPACAGEPSNPLRPVRHRWVYPRVCGGTETMQGREALIEGLSPRVRGNPH